MRISDWSSDVCSSDLIIESIENNPFLQDSEEISSFAGSGAGPTRDTDALPAPDAGMSPVPTLEHHQADDPASLTSHETPGESRADSSFSGDYPASRRNDRPNSDVGQWARYDAGSGEDLRADLAGYSLSDRDRRLVENIINELDEDGSLSVAFRDLANRGQFSPPVHGSSRKAAPRRVQH